MRRIPTIPNLYLLWRPPGRHMFLRRTISNRNPRRHSEFVGRKKSNGVPTPRLCQTVMVPVLRVIHGIRVLLVTRRHLRRRNREVQREIMGMGSLQAILREIQRLELKTARTDNDVLDACVICFACIQCFPPT